MTALQALVAAQPGWAWLALAAALLASEAATGSGYLLWPAASAGAVGLLLLAGAPMGLAAQVMLFAAGTLALTLAARRWWPRRPRAEDPPDLNDIGRRLVGHEGRVVADGRVLVEGKEWAAEWDGGAAPPAGAMVRVVAVVGGARLRMRTV